MPLDVAEASDIRLSGGEANNDVAMPMDQSALVSYSFY